MKIEFYKERFYLETVPYSGGTKVVVENDIKKSLRYQLLFLVNPETDEFDAYSLEGTNTVSLPKTYKVCWVIKKTKEICNEPQNYEFDEVQLIKNIICYFADKKTEITEKLCSSLGDKILFEYKKCYGKYNIENFKKNIFDIRSSKSSSSKLNYGRPRYSLTNLLIDFKNTPDLQIYLDKELVGKYKRISRKMIDGSETVLTKWAKFINPVGNRARANISIQVISKVKVEIPENEFGVKPGERELNALRNFTLVADGVLNMEWIGIKTSNNKLIGKLKRLGVVEPLLLSDEYIVDLTKLPIFHKPKILNSGQLGYAEYKVRESDVRVKYIELLLCRKKYKISILPPRKIKEPEKSEADKFLESLGIYGNTYYPDKVKPEEPTSTYITTEIIGKVEGIPGELYPNLRSFINFGSCKNAVINDILSDISGLRTETSIEVLENQLYHEKLNRKIKINILRDLKFNIITGKLLRFSDKNKPIESAEVKVRNTKVKWIIKETEVSI